MNEYNFSTGRASEAAPVRWTKPKEGAIEAQIVADQDLADVAYRLRYEAYLDGAFIPESAVQRFSDEYDTYGNSRTVVVFQDGVPAGTVRVTRHDPGGCENDRHDLPCMKLFEHEIERLVAQLHLPARTPRLIEINRLARSTIYKNNINVIFALFRFAAYIHLEFDADIVLNAVRAHHAPMYRRFGFQQVEAPRQYPGLAMKTGLVASFPSGHAGLIEGQPFLRGISKDDAAYAGLIAGERVAIFGDNAPSAVRPAGPVAPLSQTPDGLRNCA
ncbi:MAG: hypothetical protein PHI71_16640 [Acidiphilium sp.]|nr:hypothetical protein [Acidiphilium sp.]